MAAGNFAGNFLTAFSQARAFRERREQDEREKKAKVQLFEIQLEREKNAAAREQQQQSAMQDVFSRLNGGAPLQSNPGVTLGDPRPQMSLAEMLADAGMQGTLLKAGIASPGEIIQATAPPKPTERTRFLQELAENPRLAALDRAQRASGATSVSVNTGEKLGRIPEGYYFDGQRLTKIPGGPGTAGQKATDSAFAPEYAEWVSGGFADVQKGLTQLRWAAQALESGKNVTGPWLGKVPDWAKTVINPQSVATRQAVEEVVQRNLRLVLGGQFAQKEGEALIARAYNEQLPEAENAARVNRLITQIDQAAKAKQEAAAYFAEHGTLEGFTGKLWRMSDFNPEGERGASGSFALPAGIPADSVQVGTSGGKPVYKTPDGRMLIVE